MRSLILTAALAAQSLATSSALVKRDGSTTLTQTCSKPGVPFNYVGCYTDPSSPRALSYDPGLSKDNMTVELCTAACRQAGYRYAGLEYYFQCFCGASVTGPGLAADSSECSYACTGDSSEVCGGFDRVSVYEDPNFSPVDGTTISDYMYQGCYTDNDSNGRALAFRQDQVSTDTATREICLQACKNGGYSHAGMEYYGECYCGVVLANSSQPTSESVCNTPCKGDTSETCGGPGAISLFVAQDLEAAPPCPPDDPTTTYPVSSSTVVSTSTSTSTSTKGSYPTTTSTSTTTSKYPTTSSTTSSVVTTKTTTTTTTSKGTTLSTTTTTTASTCSASAPAPTCEFGCGNWCSQPLPWWSGGNWAQSAAFCKLQIASCFANAGWPAATQCWDFMNWCYKVPSYNDKPSFMKGCPPKNPPPTTTGVCTPTQTPTQTTASVVPPTVSGICSLPTGSPGSGYEGGKCVGDIKPPFLTCNDIYADWRQNPFKLYTDKQSSNCPSYGRGGAKGACQNACKIQYQSCVNTYAQSCKTKSSGPSYGDAVGQCKNQYYDCLDANNYVSTGNRCSSWNGGWS